MVGAMHDACNRADTIRVITRVMQVYTRVMIGDS